MPHLLISAAHKSSGKTTITIGLCAALAETCSVQPFKKGPDYIDPMWLSRAANRPCHNLDFYTMQKSEIINTLSQHSQTADISIIEANKGLYDGLDLDGSNSNAALATLSHSPVILVLDARGMTRGIAPLILGYQAFDKNIHIAGVILNQLGGSRHEQKLRNVIEHYTDINVVGAVYRNEKLSIEERHLGLMPSNEDDSADIKIAQIRDIVKEQIDVESIRTIASLAPKLPAPTKALEINSVAKDLRIGIAHNDAFGFYYPGDLTALENAGAELVYIDPIRDTKLASIDGLFIGGGFPETRMEELAANTPFKQQLKLAIENGLPCYAECGGLMYLSRSLSWKNQTSEMVGIVQADTIMHKRPQGRGYIRLEETRYHPWHQFEPTPDKIIAGHEFHYSALENIDTQFNYAYKVIRGQGIDGENDGIVYKNLLACYAHLRDTQTNHWAQRFIQLVRQHKQSI